MDVLPGACSHMLLMWSWDVLWVGPLDQGVDVPLGEASWPRDELALSEGGVLGV